MMVYQTNDRKGGDFINANYNRYVHGAAIGGNVSIIKANAVIDTFLNEVTTDIINGKTVTIPKLGSFAVKGVKERRIKDINTGEYRIIPAKTKIRYNPNKWILTQVN